MDAGERREFDYITMFRLGMVIVVVSKAQIVVRWNVNDIDEKSLEAVMDFLDSLVTSPKVMIEYYFGGWERRFVSDAKAAIRTLEATKRLRATTPILKPFVKQMALSEVNDARPMVQRGFRAWMKSGGVFSMDPERPWRSYLKRSLIFTHHKKTSRLMYRHLGRDAALIRVKGRQWAESVVGKSCGRSLENIKAGDILSNVYDQVICGTEPRFDHIRACIPRADDEIEWVSYQRLLMPVTIKGGEPALICLSVTTPDVSIPTPVQNA